MSWEEAGELLAKLHTLAKNLRQKTVKKAKAKNADGTWLHIDTETGRPLHDLMDWSSSKGKSTLMSTEYWWQVLDAIKKAKAATA